MGWTVSVVTGAKINGVCSVQGLGGWGLLIVGFRGGRQKKKKTVRERDDSAVGML